MSASVEEKDLSRQKRHVVDIKNTFSLLLLSVLDSVLDSIWRTGIVLERETVLDCPSLNMRWTLTIQLIGRNRKS